MVHVYPNITDSHCIKLSPQQQRYLEVENNFLNLYRCLNTKYIGCWIGDYDNVIGLGMSFYHLGAVELNSLMDFIPIITSWVLDGYHPTPLAKEVFIKMLQLQESNSVANSASASILPDILYTGSPYTL